jgi:hypothetical protein
MNPSITDYPFIAIGSARININAIAFVMPKSSDGALTIRLIGGGAFNIEAKYGPAVLRNLQAFVFPGAGGTIEANVSYVGN